MQNMENQPAVTSAEVEKSASPSVAQLAGRFKEQAAAISGKEVPPSRPTRRKPPCSLPLHIHKVEAGQNNEQKPSPNAGPLPKVKVKSSPLIEKLQANLAFAPAALLPGASPKSPGLKVMPSPFSTPPSTPSSPGIQSRSSESDEAPVSFDQPPEGTHLQTYNKVRTRGSIKRRPPSRRFRKSLSDYGDGEELGATVSSQENGAKEENGDEVFAPKGKTDEPETESKAMQKQIGSDEKSPSRRRSFRTESKDEREKQAGETAPCQSSTEEETVTHHKSSTGEEEGKSDKSNAETLCQVAVEDKEEKVCKSTVGEKEDDSVCEPDKRDKEKEEVEKKEVESNDTQEKSDIQEKDSEPGTLQLAANTDTASEKPSVTPTQELGTE
ncbi:capZ-interacting protein [Alligator sinensis]|uniref:CapZ-interacting protein n=1 Tax=Alligator sinensis TaxID=38654 RepID=A0A1U7RFA0_ALLSI|nr:capZ-interacting protein [Alligator sinensis]XP_025053999.1 capZ-interacting protein [Alligator sinensis]